MNSLTTFFFKISRLFRKITGRKLICFWLISIEHYKFHRVNFRHGGSYIDSLDSMKMKKTNIRWENKNDKCFQSVVTVILNHGKFESHSERALDI